jgi:hypothetical protein
MNGTLLQSDARSTASPFGRGLTHLAGALAAGCAVVVAAGLALVFAASMVVIAVMASALIAFAGLAMRARRRRRSGRAAARSTWRPARSAIPGSPTAGTAAERSSALTLRRGGLT